MLYNLKPYIVVIFLSVVMFVLTKPFCMKYMSESSFLRRRNIWLALSTAAFLSPTFWIYALLAAVVLIVGYRRDDNPMALYVLVSFTAPNARYYIPFPLFQQFFDLNQYRMLSLVLLVPLVVQFVNTKVRNPQNRFSWIDALMLGFIAIQVVLQISYESPTNTLRRAFLLTLDVYLFVVAFSRLGTKAKIADVMACFWLSCALMAPVAIFEWAKSWLMYTGINQLWGDPNTFSWLFRGDSLRAQAATGHSLNLGYVCTVGLGFFLYLRQGFDLKKSWMFGLLLMGAILVSSSRGALLAALIALIVFYGTRPNALRQIAKIFAVAAIVLVAMYFSPLKESVIDRLPLIGTADQENIEYRRVLLEASWTLIQQHPFFGDPFAANQLEFLKQGQGIIDIVNGYVYFALFTGLIGLAFLVGSLALALRQAAVYFLSVRRVDHDSALMGASLIAVFLASLFFVGTAGFSSTVYILIGVLASYGKLRQRAVVPVMARPPVRRTPAAIIPARAGH